MKTCGSPLTSLQPKGIQQLLGCSINLWTPLLNPLSSQATHCWVQLRDMGPLGSCWLGYDKWEVSFSLERLESLCACALRHTCRLRISETRLC